MRAIIRPLVKFTLTWKFLKLLYRIAYRFKFEKDLIEIEKQNAIMESRENKLKEKFSDLVVRGGPFKGMRYPGFLSHGSSLYPKLLGCYESELFGDLEQLLKNDYKTIVDVGCAEGYYAVGIAMRKPGATVYAYDIKEDALQLCKKMAVLNGVTDRMRFGGFCNAETLASFDFSQRALIICDCEGYEAELFNIKSLPNLKNCDLLIELHDLYNNEQITPGIEKLFKNTHHIKLVYSENTFKRMGQLKLNDGISPEDIQTFFTERNGIMQWAIITAKE